MSRRLSIVDLTSAHPSSNRRSSASSYHDRQSITRWASQVAPTPRGIKRRRGEDGSRRPSTSALVHEEDDSFESIDLTESENSLAKTLAKQRQDAVKAQQLPEEEKSRSVLGSYKCPVCMDTPEDATSTACGHLFCHRCIVEYLNSAADQRLDSSKQPRGTCPICRKGITRNEKRGPGRSLIPLQLKLTTKKRDLVPPAEA